MNDLSFLTYTITNFKWLYLIHGKKQWTPTTAVHYCSLGSISTVSDFTQGRELGTNQGRPSEFPLMTHVLLERMKQTVKSPRIASDNEK